MPLPPAELKQKIQVHVYWLQNRLTGETDIILIKLSLSFLKQSFWHWILGTLTIQGHPLYIEVVFFLLDHSCQLIAYTVQSASLEHVEGRQPHFFTAPILIVIISYLCKRNLLLLLQYHLSTFASWLSAKYNFVLKLLGGSSYQKEKDLFGIKNYVGYSQGWAVFC